MQKKLQEEEQERKNQLLVSERDKSKCRRAGCEGAWQTGISEKAEAEQKIKELDKQKKRWIRIWILPRKRFRNAARRWKPAKTKKKTLEKQIAGNKETDMEELVQARQEVSGAKKELQKADGYVEDSL